MRILTTALPKRTALLAWAACFNPRSPQRVAVEARRQLRRANLPAPTRMAVEAPHGHAYTTANTYIHPNANAAGDV